MDIPQFPKNFLENFQKKSYALRMDERQAVERKGLAAGTGLSARTAVALADPKILDEAFEHVANGGTLISLARAKDIKHGALHNFVCATAEGRKRYAEALNQRAEFDRETVMGKLRSMLQTDARAIFNAEGAVLPPNEWPDGVAAMVAGLEVHEDFGKVDEDEDPDHVAVRERIGRTAKVKLVDPLRVMELMGRELGMFAQKVDVTHKVTLASLVEESLGEPAPAAAPQVIEEATIVDAVPRETEGQNG